jgi:hypothetical protein
MNIDLSFNLKRALYIGGITLLVAFIVLYSYRTARPLVQGVQLTLQYPPPDITNFEEAVIQIEGSSPKARTLEINGNLLVIDETGRFSEPFVLSPGYNEVTIQAIDKYDKVSTVHRTWYYKALAKDIDTTTLQINPEETVKIENAIIKEPDSQTTIN